MKSSPITTIARESSESKSIKDIVCFFLLTPTIMLSLLLVTHIGLDTVLLGLISGKVYMTGYFL